MEHTKSTHSKYNINFIKRLLDSPPSLMKGYIIGLFLTIIFWGTIAFIIFLGKALL